MLDVDGHNSPNLCQMKISAYHKARGDQVERFIGLNKYDKVYVSKVFTFSPDYEFAIQADEIQQGGTGYDLQNKLPDEIEHQYPDYSLYNIKNIAYGFLTRGCPRNCPFCIVGEKEGLNSCQVADLSEFWRGQKYIKLLDPNLLACKNKIELLKELVNSKASVDFTQGLDIRLMDSEATDLIKQIKLKMVHFAWDRPHQEDLIIRNLQTFKKATDIDFRKARIYILTNYETPFDYDLYRIYKTRELGFDPYIMIYDKETAPKKIKRLQRWVNNKFIFRSCERFEDYMKGEYK